MIIISEAGMWFTGNFCHHNPKLAGILYVITIYSGIAHLKIVGFHLLASKTLRYGIEKVDREAVHMLGSGWEIGRW